MTKIITVANQKGGVGKTTVCCNLAVEAAKEGYKVLILDADKQKSSMVFRANRGDKAEKHDISAFIVNDKNVLMDSQKLQADFDIAFIDGGGHNDVLFRACLYAAARGMILLPLKGSELDFRSSQETIDIIQKAREVGVNIPAYAVWNMAKARTIVGNQINSLMGEYAPTMDVGYLGCRLGDREAFVQSYSLGLGVSEYDPTSKAAAELALLWEEVKEKMGLNKEEQTLTAISA